MSPARVEENACFCASTSVRTCELDGEVVLLDIARGEYFGLGDLGSRAWVRLVNGKPVSEVAGELVELYEVELVRLTGDLLIFTRELRDAGLLVSRPE